MKPWEIKEELGTFLLKSFMLLVAMVIISLPTVALMTLLKLSWDMALFVSLLVTPFWAIAVFGLLFMESE